MEPRFRSRYGRVAVFRAAAVVFLVCCAGIAAVVFTLDLNARRSNEEQAGTELARLAKIVIRRLFPDGDQVPVAMSGGVFSNCALVRQVFYNSLRSEYPNCSVNPTIIEAVRGALDLARKAAKV